MVWAKFRSPSIVTVSSSDHPDCLPGGCLLLLLPWHAGSSVKGASNPHGLPGLPWAHSLSHIQREQRCRVSKAAPQSWSRNLAYLCWHCSFQPFVSWLSSPHSFTQLPEGALPRTGCHHVGHACTHHAHTHTHTTRHCQAHFHRNSPHPPLPGLQSRLAGLHLPPAMPWQPVTTPAPRHGACPCT